MDTPVKTCSKCGETKPLTEFPPNRATKSGIAAACKVCDRKRHAIYRENNRDKINTQAAEFRERNRDWERERSRLYRVANPEKRKESCRRWRQNHTQEDSEYHKQYRVENRLTIRQKGREYYHSNIEKERLRGKIYRRNNRVKENTKTRNYRARKRNAEGNHTVEETRDLFQRQKGKCYYCHKKLINPFTKEGKGEIAHLDHVIPLKRGGRNDIGNLVWACGFCNDSKGDKLPHEWHRNNGRLI